METVITPHPFINPGAQDKPVDTRDIKLGSAIPTAYTFPPVLTNDKAWAMQVEYQGQQPACGAHAGAELKDLALNSRFSPRFTWYDIKRFDNSPLDAGTDIRSIFKSITKDGTLSFNLLGNDVTLTEDAYAHPVITRPMRLDSAGHAGMGYGFINDLTFNGIKQFISDHGPTILLLRVGAEWWTAPNGTASWLEKDILPIRPPAAVVSGHFVTAHSYDEQYIYFVNHWSDQWGRRGHGYFGQDYMHWVIDAGALFPLTIDKDIYYGMTDPEVVVLQKYLNTNGYPVAPAGPGSPGNETDYFGGLTKSALGRFQAVHGITPSTGYCGPLTRAYITQHA
jgi:hypothetical protein